MKLLVQWSVNEKAFQKSLESLYGLVTTVAIAHKMSTIRNCDKIFVLEELKLFQMGITKVYKNLAKFSKLSEVN